MFGIPRGLSSASHAIAAIVVVIGLFATGASAAAESLGDFEARSDVGTVDPAGKASYDAARKEYRITSAGQNIWAKHDDFHFVHRKVSGDVVMTADIALGDGTNAHRKGGCMIRQDLEPDSAYVDVVVHGDGHIAIQYRSAKGDITKDIKSEVMAPATLQLERKGDTFTAYATEKQDEKAASPVKPERKMIGTVKVALKDPVYAGLAVTSHEAKSTATAVFTNVSVKTEAGKPEPGK
jgi:hypothetical protein